MKRSLSDPPSSRTAANRPARRVLKERVREALRSPDVTHTLFYLRSLPLRPAINALISALYIHDAQIRWHAVTGLGALVADLADEDPEAARVVMRRFMWTLNDESGGIGWGAPEAMGEIVAVHEALAREYAPLVVSYVREDGNYLELEPLQRGAVWAVARAAQTRAPLLSEAKRHLSPYLNSPDPEVRGLAAWAVRWLPSRTFLPQLRALLTDPTPIPLYWDRVYSRRSVRELAGEAIVAVEQEQHPAAENP